MPHPSRRARGQALVELAVALPLFAALLAGAQLLHQQVLRKLQLQQAGHYATLELTAFPLSDYGRSDHPGRLRQAVDQVAREVRREFGTELAVSEGEWLVAPPTAGGDFGLNGGGRLRVEARSGPFLSREVLAVDGWALPDGSDAVIRESRAGNRRTGAEPHLLHTQVSRMTFAGARGPTGVSARGVARLLSALGVPLPDWAGTFVVAHNYGPARANQPGCEGIPGYPKAARGGLSRFGSEALDFDRPQCFDTAPLRDTQSYERSLYLQMFLQRGQYFMGRPQLQADESGAGSSFGAFR